MTGLPRETARADFARQRRRRALASIGAHLRFEPDDVSAMLPFEEVVAALGRKSQRDLGIQLIPLDSIVGTVDRRRGEFDRSFRPADPAVRGRWERIAEARHALLATLVEAWGFRASHAREQLLSRPEMARAWFEEDYEPVVKVLLEADLAGPGTETERYLRTRSSRRCAEAPTPRLLWVRSRCDVI